MTATGQDDRIEVELKLAIAEADARRVARLPLIRQSAAGRASTRAMHSIYFDTPEGALRRAQAALRLRREGTRWMQTLKFGGSVEGGLHARHEAETRVAGPVLDRQSLAQPAVVPILGQPGLLEQLIPMFTADFRRTTRLLAPAPDTTIELCIDLGEIRAGDRREALCEIELELKSGAPAVLVEFADALLQQLPGRLEPASKAERGYALAMGRREPAPVRAEPASFNADGSLEEAFRAIVFGCIRQLQANEAGVGSGEDPEYLHQARVALRRLRAALATFDSAFPRASYAGLIEELRWLGRCLGPARDWDVFVTETLPPVLRAFPEDGGLSVLAQRAASLRAETGRIAGDALASVRYTRLLLGFTGLFLRRPWLSDASAEAVRALTPRDFARQMLARRHKRVVKRGRGHEHFDHSALHALRIEVKKLRYAAESVGPLFERKAVRNYLDTLAGLQSLLGGLNDAATVDRLCRPLRDAAMQVGVEESVGLLRGWAAALAEDHLSALPREWKRFRAVEQFW